MGGHVLAAGGDPDDGCENLREKKDLNEKRCDLAGKATGREGQMRGRIPHYSSVYARFATDVVYHFFIND